MTIDREKLRKMHGMMQQNGYTQDYATFEKKFVGNDNYANRKKVYDLFSQNGADVGSSYNDFMDRLQAKPVAKKSSIAQKAQQVANEYNEQQKMRNSAAYKAGQGMWGAKEGVTKPSGDWRKEHPTIAKIHDTVSDVAESIGSYFADAPKNSAARNNERVQEIKNFRQNQTKKEAEQQRRWNEIATLTKKDSDLTPLERSQASRLRKGMQAGQAKSSAEEMMRNNNPIMSSKVGRDIDPTSNELLTQLGTDKERLARIKQQHEDDATQLAYQGVGQNLGNDIFSEVDKGIEQAKKNSIAFMNGALNDGKSASRLLAMQNDQISQSVFKAAQGQESTEAIQKAVGDSVMNKVNDYFSRPNVQKNILDSAAKMNMDTEEYLQKYVMPGLMQYAKDAVSQRKLENEVPKSFWGYLAKNASNSILGMMVQLDSQTKENRQLRQQALAVSEGMEKMPQMTGHKGADYYEAGLGSRFLGTAANMALDSGPLAAIGTLADGAVSTGARLLVNGLEKAGIKNAAKLTAREAAFKAANMTTAQKVASGLLNGVPRSSLNLGGYSAITSALGQASTGDDTSLAAVASAGWEGFKHGATTGAMFGTTGALMRPWVQRYGITGKERTTSQRNLHGAQKLGAEATALGVEAGTMMVADNLTGDKEISMAQFLEDGVMVLSFKLGEPKNYKHIGSALYGLTHNTSNSPITLTQDERNELLNSVSGKNLMEVFSNFNKVAKSYPRVPSYGKAYSDFMNDPEVSRATKEKVNAALGVPSQNFKVSQRSVNDVKNKQILEYASDGTLLSRTSYKNAEQRRDILFRQKTERDNMHVWNLLGYAKLKARDVLGDDGQITPMAVAFMKEHGYDLSKEPTNAENAKIIADIKNPQSNLHRDWEKYADEHQEDLGLTDEIKTILSKDPLKRTDDEVNKIKEYRNALEAQLFPDSKPNTEQAQIHGRTISEDNDLGTDKPNSEAVVTELRTLQQYEDEMTQLMESNDVFSQNFKELQKQGLTNPQIFDWMIQQGSLTEEQLAPFAKYMNQVAKVQGMQQATAQAIEEHVGAFVQDWTFHGTMDGNKMNGEQALLVKDSTGRTLLVGSGDVAYDPTTGRPKEGVGDMLVCLDPNTRETVYVKVDETTLLQTEEAAKLEADERQRLQMINSEPYNQAAQEQAVAEPKSEEKASKQEAQPEEQVAAEQPQQDDDFGQESLDDQMLDDVKPVGKSSFGDVYDQFKGNAKGAVKLLLRKKGGEAIGALHHKDVGDIDLVWGKEGTGHSNGFGLAKLAKYHPEVLDNLQEILDGMHVASRSKNRINLESDTHKAAIRLEWDGQKKSWLLTAFKKEEASADGKTTDTSNTSLGGDTALSQTEGSSSVGKDTNNSSNGNGLKETLTFKDGTEVPVDANGEPDFMQMTPEQGVEVYKTLFPKTYEAEVDNTVKMLEADLKKVQKATPKSSSVMARAKEQKDIDEAVGLAEAQLAKAKEIKKTMTAEKVAETVGKPKDEPVEGANQAGSVASEKFNKSPRLVGNKRTRTLADGKTKIRGHYEIVSAESLTPSHDAMNGYKKSEGFPVDENGRTVNDRDYEHDKAAQVNTDQIARNYNGQAIDAVPVVSDEGIVYDGNGRTMAGQKAAKDGTDGEYIRDLMENAENFGFTREQIEKSGIEHPRLVLVSDERLPYDTQTFAKFNRNEKKTQSNTEQAVANAKSLSPEDIGAIVAEIDGNGSLEAFFNNPKAINGFIKTLLDKGVILQNDVAELMEGDDHLSPQGKEKVKNILLGSIFKPETIRMLGIDSAIKNKAIAGIRAVMDNLKLGDYSLRDEIDQAIQLLYEARRKNDKVDTLLRTKEAFDENATDRYPSISQMLALALEGKVADFRDLLDEYNRNAAARNTGEGHLFGEAPTKEEFVKEFLDFKKWVDYDTRGNQEREGGNDVPGVQKPESEAQGGNGSGKPESKPKEGVEDIKSIFKRYADELFLKGDDSKKLTDFIKEKYNYVKDAFESWKSEDERRTKDPSDPNFMKDRRAVREKEKEFESSVERMLNDMEDGLVGSMRNNAIEAVKIALEKDRSTADPMEAIKKSAEEYKQEQIDKAAEAYKAAKESGDEEQIDKAAKELKHLMDENMKEKGYSLPKRQAAIAMIVGKKEAETIDKPFEEMDSEEREFVASKNPLTESEIRELTPAEDKNFIEDAVDYVNGNHGPIQKLAYLKIYKDVRSGHESAASNSGAADGAQLAPADNGSGEELGLGRGRESGRPSGELDRGTGDESSSRERGSGESGENDTHLSAGEPSDKQGEGTASRVGDVPARSAESDGGSGNGKDRHVPERGGREGSNRPAGKNAKRKPTAKQGTTWRGRTGEEIKKNVEEKKAAALAAIAKLKSLKYDKNGSGYAGSMALFTPRQMEELPTVTNAIKDYGMAIIDQGIYKVKDWLNNIRDTFMDALVDMGFTETEADRYIKAMWNSKMEMDGETHTIADWCSIYGQSTLRKKLNEELDEKRQRQMDAEPIEVKVGDRKNIEETLPYLLPQQQEDVYRAETQFFGKEHADREHAYGKGYMFTNGTGTGKTYTGLGIAKRLVKQGKKRILFVTPSDKKVKDWIKDGKNLGLDIRSLDDWAKERGTTATTESGEDCVITTFANFGVNKKLLETEWDAVIYDESHRIMENKKGTETARSMQHYKLTNRDESHCFLRLQDINPHYQKMQRYAEDFAKQYKAERQRIIKEYQQTHPSATTKDVINATHRMMPKDINGFAPADGQTFPKLGEIHKEFIEAKNYYRNEVEPQLKKQAKDTWKNTKTIFLSATPFNTRENLDYAEGYIFKYPESDDSGMSGRTRFYLDHFGAAYKYRYHRLEESISNPEAVSKQEIAFSDYLQQTLGTMSGRIIDSTYDYSRDFPTVAPDHADDFNNAVQECFHTRHLYQAYAKTIGDYNYGSALFETMKVANIIGRIKEHLDAGRKVVIYHRRVETKEPIRPPFAYMLDVANNMIAKMSPGKERDEFIAEANEFRQKHQDLLQWEQTLDYSMPREQIAKVFGNDNVLFFSGKESKGTKDKAVDTFNEDDSGKNILVIQEASGKEGISLHDTTGKHQRVVITLALPQSPITALQIEGRIYRIGNKSNAIFEYPILGLNSEMILFGQKFNGQVSTTENLALGSQARNLRDSFAKGILEHSGIVPIDQQGVGGKEFDAPKQAGETDPFDDAVLDYYSNHKLNKNNRQGVDYFPTPEPLGYKMVQWAGLGEGDSVLEPSAGHGAIARYVPSSNELVSIEPSQSLFSKLQLKVGGLGRKYLNGMFEDYAINNKHDAIVMNPPFGTAGATAIRHIAKAFRHLDEGGRIVAIIPRGSTDKKFESWMEMNKDAVMRAEVNLPDITFQQAGTSVRCRVVVLDKITNEEMRAKAGYPEKIDLGGHYDKIEDFFEDLRDIEMPGRIIDTNFKVQKKSRQTVKDIKAIKGVRAVDMDKNGITVKIKGDNAQYGMTFYGSENPELFKESMAGYYKQYDKLGKKTYYDDAQLAVFDELKKLSCKLAGMTEEEMQRFIKTEESNRGTHFRMEENNKDTDNSENLFVSLQSKQNNRKEYNDTVTELANRVKQGTARIVREGKDTESDRAVNRQESLPAIAGRILLSENQQGNGQTGGLAREASNRQGEKILQNNTVYGQIEDWAKENGCHYTESDIAKDSLDGKVWNEGCEANVYRSNDGKSVIKVMPLDKFQDNPIAYSLDRNNYFNDVFPDTAIEVLGYGKDNNGNAAIIFKQPLVEGKTVLEYFNGNEDAANNYIDKLLSGMGYNQKVAHDEWGCLADSNGKYNLFDVNYKNVIIDKDGNPHVIDAEVLPVDYKNDGKIEIKDSESAHFRAEDSVRISDDAPVVVKHVDRVAKQVGGKVKMVQHVGEITNKEAREAIEQGKNVTGWYDEKTGEVHLYMPNIHDRYTAEKTIWHEVVGHKGLRGLFGDKFDDFLNSVWFDLDKPENATLKKLVMEEMKFNPFNRDNAIEEGLARLAEEGRGEQGFWNNIKNKITDFLHEIGYRIAPNTKDVKYLLWLGKNLQKHPNDAYWKIRAEAVKYRLEHEDVPAMKEHEGMFFGDDKVRSLETMTKKEYEEATDGKIHFRTTPSAATALDRYHKALDEHGYMLTESYMDNMLSLKKLMQAIVPSAKNIVDIKSSENPYILQNTMQGAMSNAARMFEDNVMKPLDKAMARVLDAFDGKKDHDKIKDFNLYMIKKHGLERNRVFFVRDYISTLEKADADILQKQWNAEKKDLGTKLSSGLIDLREYYTRMDDWIRNNVDATFVAGEHDYSGFHGLEQNKQLDKNDPYNDDEIITSVMDKEASMESVKQGSVRDFWNKVRTATQYSLDCDYNNGFVTKENHDNVSAMFDWYIPLRKYDETTAEDVYGYITEKGDPSSFIGPALMKAKGRKSLSETNILAQIGAMGNSAINRGGKNAIKQAFARFIRNNGGQGLVTEANVWIKKDGTNADGSDRWVETYPQIPEDATPDEISKIVSDFNNDMMAKQAAGEAKNLSQKGNIGFKFERAKDRSQHIVDVMIAGKKHSFIVNGNPRAAQALNGLLENSSAKGIMKPLGSISRMMAQLCTSYNPEFVMRNIMRDAEFASSNVTAKEGARYGAIWAKYYAQLGLYKGAQSISLKDLSGTTGLGLFAKYRNGTLDMNDKVQRYFKEFMENGGETGWVQIKNMKEWEKQYKQDVKAERSKIHKSGKMIEKFFFGNLENLNEVAENIARFSTYCASRDFGRSVVRSVYDAKEVSTNFNRHGSGDAIKSFKNGEMGTAKSIERWAYGFSSSYLRHCSMFFNAGIQSTNLLVKNLKTNPVGTSVNMLAMPFALGALAALGNNALIASEDEKDRKGVKDPYGELPDYIRRNNLCIYKGGGEFVTIPLAIELRAFYGLGDLAAGLTFSPNVSGQKNPWFDAVGSMSQLVPVMDYLGNSSAGKDPIGETVKAITPSALSPLVEWGMNSDWKGSPIERRGDYNKNVPAWQRAYNGIPLKGINKWVNAQTNDVAKGNEDMLGNRFLDMVTNPSMLHHFFGGVGGGLATFGGRVLGLAQNGKDTETKDIPFVRSLLYTPSEQTSLQRTKSKWYNYKDEMETIMANVSRLKSKNVPIDKMLSNISDYYQFQDSKEASKVRIIELAEKQMNQWKKSRDRATDTESVNFANQNIDQIMMDAVEELDKLE